jgi:hemerythrin superfamily protein
LTSETLIQEHRELDSRIEKLVERLADLLPLGNGVHGDTSKATLQNLDLLRGCQEELHRIRKQLLEHIYIEEELLFPHVPPEATGLIDGMLLEHGSICKLFYSTSEALKAGRISDATRALSLALRALRGHDIHEEKTVYPLLDKLSPEVPQRGTINIPEDYECRILRTQRSR